MATSSSLVVKISADVNDFSRALNNMTRDVDRAAKKLEGIGKSLTLGITVPVAAATVALSKMAAENEDVGARVERVFGSMASSVNASIKTMMQSVPETQTDLQKMAISIDNMAQGMGLAPQNAARMSESLLKLAGDASAFAHVPMEQALDALSRGLAGKTKGLLEFGIAINESDIKQRAMQMGLLNTGNQLTETGTALAAYSLIMERSGRITGEAARTADQSGKSFQFLKRDVSELADKVSALVLPSMSSLARGAIDIVNALSNVPDSITKTVFALAAFAAVAGPLVYGITKIAQTINSLRAGITLLKTTGSLVGFFASLANPITATIIAVGALTAAFVALYAIWQKFSGSSVNAQMKQDLSTDPTLNAALTKAGVMKPGGPLDAKNGPTQFNPKDAFDQLKEQASIVSKAFDDALEHGDKLSPIFQRVNAIFAEGAKLLQGQGGALTLNAEKARDVVNEMQRLKDIQQVIMSGNPNQVVQAIANRPIDVGAQGAQAAVDAAYQYRTDLAKRLGQSSIPTPFNADLEAAIKSRGAVAGNANDLALRESMLKLPDGFDAARQAAVDLAEAQRQTAEDTALQFEKIKIQLGPLGSALNGFSSGMQAVVVSLAASAQNFALQLVARLGGSGQSAGTGRGIGSLIGTGLGLAVGGVAGAFVGNILGTAAGGLIGGMFDHAKASTDNAATAMDSLAKTVDRVNQSISNIPQYFKLAAYELEVLPPIPRGALGGAPVGQTGTPPVGTPLGGTGVPGTGGDGATKNGNIVIQNFHANLPGVRNAADFIRELANMNLRAQATGAAGTFAFSGGPTL